MVTYHHKFKVVSIDPKTGLIVPHYITGSIPKVIRVCDGGITKLKKGETINNKTMRGVPKRDGSGMGVRANRGRSGCRTTRSKGKGYGGR